MNKRMSKCHTAIVIGCISLTFAHFAYAHKSPHNASLRDASQKGFNPNGGYDVLGEAPGGFEHINRLFIFRNQGKRKSRYQSSLQSFNRSTDTSVEYKFIASVITRDKFTFTTASVAGISYSFEGSFLSDQPYRVEESKPAIEGQLIKYKNGKKASQGKIRFTPCECVD